jgi:hypothetical protein
MVAPMLRRLERVCAVAGISTTLTFETLIKPIERSCQSTDRVVKVGGWFRSFARLTITGYMALNARFHIEFTSLRESYTS